MPSRATAASVSDDLALTLTTLFDAFFHHFRQREAKGRNRARRSFLDRKEARPMGHVAEEVRPREHLLQEVRDRRQGPRNHRLSRPIDRSSTDRKPTRRDCSSTLFIVILNYIEQREQKKPKNFTFRRNIVSDRRHGNKIMLKSYSDSFFVAFFYF
jgi:hypothetical protein